MRRAAFCLALVLCLGLLSVEARGDSARPVGLQQFLDSLWKVAGAKPMASKPPQAHTEARCTAQCGGGATVYVDCPGSCTAVDRNCPEKGYAECAGGWPRADCTNPCGCEVEMPCPGGGSVWCAGNDSCEEQPGYCYVVCDGYYTSCPICF